MARSHFSYEKRRKELEKKKKKAAKRQAKAERKAAKEAGVDLPEPKIEIDEFGNVIEVYPEGYDENGLPLAQDDDESEEDTES